MRYHPFEQTVLALETSCDESAVAVVRNKAGKIQLISSKIASQIEEHSQWGGVVPEIASRRHLEALPCLVNQVIGSNFQNIDAIAATVAPGLTGALMAGSVTGRTLAAFYGLPFLGIHHLEGHLASVFLSEHQPNFPYLVLLVSGGHTELIHVSAVDKFERLGRSHDDAAGEAFDKVARLLGLAYPGGPAIQKIARNGDPDRFFLPKGRVSRPEGGFFPYDFSFSGLKTAMLRKVQAIKESGKALPLEDLAASFEKVVAEVLVERSLLCAQDKGLETLIMVGGVAANERLRRLMNQKAKGKGIKVHLAPKAFCTDNAAMIGAAALKRLEYGLTSSSLELGVSARWPLTMANSLYQITAPF